MSELETTPVDSTPSASVESIAPPLVLLADANASSRARRAVQFQTRGFRVVAARTAFEAIVKASCLVPDLILLAASLGEDAATATLELLSTCPATSHIPIFQLPAGRRVPRRVFARAHC